MYVCTYDKPFRVLNGYMFIYIRSHAKKLFLFLNSYMGIFYVNTYMYTYTYRYVYVNIYTYVHICKYMYVHTCNICMYTFVHTFCAYMYVYICAYMYLYIHIHIHIHECIEIYNCSYIHVNTNILIYINDFHRFLIHRFQVSDSPFSAIKSYSFHSSLNEKNEKKDTNALIIFSEPILLYEAI
jgi:hypothetical protein